MKSLAVHCEKSVKSVEWAGAREKESNGRKRASACSLRSFFSGFAKRANSRVGRVALLESTLFDLPRGCPHQHEADRVIIPHQSPHGTPEGLLSPSHPPLLLPAHTKKKYTKIDQKSGPPRSNAPTSRDTPHSSSSRSPFFSSYLTLLQSWHVYPRPLISHTIPPTHADSTTTTTTATTMTTTTMFTTTMMAPVYESAALTMSTSTFPTPPPRPRASSPPRPPRARATPPGSQNGLRPQPQARPSTRSAQP